MTGDEIDPKTMVFAGESDQAVALRVRMLYRDQIDHEAVCCGARDRIMYLSQELARRTTEVTERKALIQSLMTDINAMKDREVALLAEGRDKDTYIDYLQDALGLIASLDYDDPIMTMRQCIQHASGALAIDQSEVVRMDPVSGSQDPEVHEGSRLPACDKCLAEVSELCTCDDSSPGTAWTKSPPTEPGFYWLRSIGEHKSYRPVGIYLVDGEPWVDGRVSRGPAGHCVGDWWPTKIPTPVEKGL